MSTELIVIFGPPAVGKAAIGYELSMLTGYKFFHNHLTADPVVAVLGYSGGRYRSIADEFRLKIFAAGIEARVAGIVFTFGWDLHSETDHVFLSTVNEMFISAGGNVHFVELTASLKTRKARLATPFRLHHKPSDTSIDARRAFLQTVDRDHTMNTTGKLPISGSHLIIDTENQTEDSAARFARDTLSLGNTS